ncbi:hypothetical protein [Xanthomonas phage JUN5]|nr:hypothetical protein [Xanthomonas phage JUN5]
MKTKTWNRAQTAAQKAQRERIVAIMARVGKDDSIADIARDLGVSRQRVSQIVKRERAKAGA